MSNYLSYYEDPRGGPVRGTLAQAFSFLAGATLFLLKSILWVLIASLVIFLGFLTIGAAKTIAIVTALCALFLLALVLALSEK